MSVLKSLESKLAGLVEGTFSRAFRSEVRPVEIARKLAREMEEHKAPSISRTYVPNEYAVFLSPRDRERFEDFEDALAKELEGYLLEHARAERLALLSRPHVTFRTDPALGLGEFGIQARLVQPPQEEHEEPRQGAVGNTMIYSTADRVRAPLEEPPPAVAQRQAVLVLDGRRIALGARGVVIGRSRQCDVVLADANVSRRHAEVRPSPGGWAVADLESTNGVLVNGRPLRGLHELAPGDAIEVGATTLRFDLE